MRIRFNSVLRASPLSPAGVAARFQAVVTIRQNTALTDASLIRMLGTTTTNFTAE